MSGIGIVLLSLTELLVVFWGVHAAAPPRRRHGGTHLSVVDRGAAAHDARLPYHGGLEPTVAKRAAVGSCRRHGPGVCRSVCPGALLSPGALPIAPPTARACRERGHQARSTPPSFLPVALAARQGQRVPARTYNHVVSGGDRTRLLIRGAGHAMLSGNKAPLRGSAGWTETRAGPHR